MYFNGDYKRLFEMWTYCVRLIVSLVCFIKTYGQTKKCMFRFNQQLVDFIAFSLALATLSNCCLFWLDASMIEILWIQHDLPKWRKNTSNRHIKREHCVKQWSNRFNDEYRIILDKKKHQGNVIYWCQNSWGVSHLAKCFLSFVLQCFLYPHS